MACLKDGFYVLTADKDRARLQSLLVDTGSDQLEVIRADFATLKAFVPQLYSRDESLVALVDKSNT